MHQRAAAADENKLTSESFLLTYTIVMTRANLCFVLQEKSRSHAGEPMVTLQS